jgi:hypothetical protein
MQLFLSRFLSVSAALSLFAAVSIAPAAAAPVTYNLELEGDITGVGSVTFNTDDASTNPAYEFRSGDSLSVVLHFDSEDVVLTEANANNPVVIPFSGVIPADVYYNGSSDSLSGFIDYISLTLGDGIWVAKYHTTAGDEGTVDGTYTFVLDGPGPELPVPAPASALLFAAGLAALGWQRRRA